MDTLIIDGFTITVNAIDECITIDSIFTGDDATFVSNGVEDGTLMWFCAEVVASKLGIPLGHAYLGGCAYESIDDFIKNSGHFEAMCAEAVADAKETLKYLGV